MQQRQYRPGDVLDDYCPRERRITDHAIVAMVEDEIQRTRCVSCDAEHEFKNARVPTQKKRASTAALFAQVLDSADAPAGRLASASSEAVVPVDAAPDLPPPAAVAAPEAPAEPPPSPDGDDRPFRRSLIRAQLPRPEGQPPPARAIPEFTMHQPQPPRGKRHGPGRFRRRPGGALDGSGPMRFGREQGNTSGGGQGGRRRRRKKH